MKKKDLKVGVVYADKRGHAYLLISTQMWQHNHYNKKWRTSRFTMPAVGQGWSFTGRGVLCLSGSAEDLRQWALEHPELLDYDDSLNSEADDQEFTDRLREALPKGSNFRIEQEDYRQWPGLYDEVKAKLDYEQELKDAEQARLRARAREYEERAEAISAVLTGRGVEATWRKCAMSTLQGDHGQSVAYVSGYKLSLTDLEKLLGLESGDE